MRKCLLSENSGGEHADTFVCGYLFAHALATPDGEMLHWYSIQTRRQPEASQHTHTHTHTHWANLGSNSLTLPLTHSLTHSLTD